MAKQGSVLVVIGDTHIGSTTALSPLRYTLHNRNTLEAQEVKANKLQRWLYECWEDFWDYVDTKSKKRRLIVAHLGDVVDGVHHNSTQLVAEVGDQVEMAIEMLSPIRERADTFIGILGTAVHAGQDHATEAAIYKALNADHVGQSITANIDGMIVDFAHHGRTGSRPWTTGAPALAAEIMLDYAQSGIELPNLIFRGHRHVLQDSGAHFENTRLIQCPSFQLKTSHGWNVAGNTVRSDIGGVLVIDGEVDLSHSRYRGQPDQRKVLMI